MPPDRYPRHYDYRFLEFAASVCESAQTYILNPRDIGNQSLFMADLDFVSDLSLHMRWKRHKKDKLKAQQGRR